MSVIHAGALYYNTGSSIPSKEALKKVLRISPSSVQFLPLSPYRYRTPIRGSDISVGDVLLVCGPNPIGHILWFAKVFRSVGIVVH